MKWHSGYIHVADGQHLALIGEASGGTTPVIYTRPPVTVRRLAAYEFREHPVCHGDPGTLKLARHFLRVSGRKLGITSGARKMLKACLATPG